VWRIALQVLVYRNGGRLREVGRAGRNLPLAHQFAEGGFARGVGAQDLYQFAGWGQADRPQQSAAPCHEMLVQYFGSLSTAQTERLQEIIAVAGAFNALRVVHYLPTLPCVSVLCSEHIPGKKRSRGE
jgi:hypothetical protein